MKHVGVRNTWITTLVLSFLLFLILYNVSFRFNASLSTGRLAVFVLFLWALRLRKSPINFLRSKVMMVFLSLPAVVLQYFLIPDFGQLSRFINLAIYSYVGAALVVIIARDVKVVLVAILLAISVQSIIIIFSFFSMEYREWFDAIQAVSASNYDANYIYRAPGFSSAGGAGLSVIQSLGVLVGWLLLKRNSVYSVVSRKFAYLVFFAMGLSVISCFLVGRTGIILSGIFLILFFMCGVYRTGFLKFLTVAVVFIFLFLSTYIFGLLGTDFSLEYYQSWAFGIFTGEDDTLNYLNSMPIPRLSSDTFFGTGLSNLIDGVNPSGHDSGFIQTYYSMGLFFAFVFYISYVYVLFYSFSWLPIILRITLTIVFFSIELKEPFLFKYSSMFVLLLLHFSHVLFLQNRRFRMGRETI